MQKYSFSMRIIHWSMALLILSIISMGFYMTNIPSSHPNKWTYYDLHKSLGIIAAFTLLLRVVFRLLSPIPALPKTISENEHRLAKYSVFLLYTCMLIMPISGYLGSIFGGYGIKVFSYSLPNYINYRCKDLSSLAMMIHGYTAFFMTFLISVHIIAPFKHLIIDKVNILKRMV